MIIQGYKYDTEAEAQTAQTALDSYYGIPVSPTDTTQNIVLYFYEGTHDFWYIEWLADIKVAPPNSMIVVLGDPIDIDIPDPPPPTI